MTADMLAGRVIVVTGGSMGIGFACAKEVLSCGASVIICARGTENLRAAERELTKLGFSNVHSVSADVSREEDVERVLGFAADEVGGLDAVIHSAGMYGPIGPVVKVDPTQWLDAIRINLFGTFLIAREACRRMIERNVAGSIVLMSGGGAATPFPNYTAYACGKVGVARLTETLALEVAEHGIRVNCIAPGFVATRLHQQTIHAGEDLAGDFLEETKKRLAEGGVRPSVAARAAAFLASPSSKGITGRFVAAPYDEWSQWPKRLEHIRGSDLFTLRRIVPRDRGMDWQ